MTYLFKVGGKVRVPNKLGVFGYKSAVIVDKFRTTEGETLLIKCESFKGKITYINRHESQVQHVE